MPKQHFNDLFAVHQDRNSHSNSEENSYTYINGLGFLPDSPQQKERKHLVICYNVLLLSILLLYFLRAVLPWPIIRLLALIGFDIAINPMTQLIGMSPIAVEVCNLLVYILSMLISAWMICSLLRQPFRFRKVFSVPVKGTTRYTVPLVIGVSIVAQVLTNLFNNVMRLGGIVLSQPKETIPTAMFPFFLYVIGATLVPAILEEFLFHGIILRALRRFGDLIAIAVSTILFTMVQQTLDNMFYSFIMGLSLGYFTLKSGSVFAPAVGNFAIRGLNLFVVIASYNASTVGMFFLYSIYFVLFAISVFMFCRFIIKDKDAFQVSSQDTFLTNRAKMRYFFSNFAFWVVVAVSFFEIIKSIQIIN